MGRAQIARARAAASDEMESAMRRSGHADAEAARAARRRKRLAAAFCTLVLLATGVGCSNSARTRDARVRDESRLRFEDTGASALRDARSADARGSTGGRADARRDTGGRGDARAGGDGRAADAAAADPLDGFGLPTNKRQAVPLQIIANASGIAALGFAQTAQDDLRLAPVFTATGPRDVLSAVLVAVDPARRYRVAGSFRSVGSELSRLYLGLAPYDAEPRFISVAESERLGEAATIAAFDATSISSAAALVGWGSSGGPAYARQLGFYFDGRTDHLPDAVWSNLLPAAITEVWYSTDPTIGAFSTAQGQTIALNAALPATITARIAAGTTRVMNQTSGGTYLYTAAAGVAVPTTWTRYEGEITGTAFNGGSSVFRPTTAYVRIALLLNYHQGTTAQLRFTELSLVAVN